MIATLEERITELEIQLLKMRRELNRCVRATVVLAGQSPEPTEDIRLGDLALEGENTGFTPRMWKGDGYRPLAGMPESVGTSELEDDSVTAAKINANVAGDGLIQAADGSLEVNDGTGLEIVSDAVRISAAAAGDGLTGGSGSALAVNAGTGLEISSDALRIASAAAGLGLTGGGASALAVNPDNSTLAISGDTVIVKALGIQGNAHIAANTLDEARRTVAIREAPSAGNTVLNHNTAAARIIYVNMGGGARTCTVENGVFDGQLLTIRVTAGGATDTLTLDNADSNLKLRGDFIARADFGEPEITLSWDSTNSWWGEMTRRTGIGSDIDGMYSDGVGGSHSISSAGTACFAAGVSHTITAPYVFAAGDFNSLAATRCGAIGSYIDIAATSDYSFGTGYRTRLRWYGELGHSAGRFNSVGHVQHSFMLLRTSTSDATVTTLSAPDTLDLEEGYSYIVRATVIGRQDPDEDAGECAYFIREALVYRDSGGSATQIGATQNVRNLASGNAGGWAVTMDVNGNDVRVRVAGSAGDTVHWGGWIDIVRVQRT